MEERRRGQGDLSCMGKWFGNGCVGSNWEDKNKGALRQKDGTGKMELKGTKKERRKEKEKKQRKRKRRSCVEKEKEE